MSRVTILTVYVLIDCLIIGGVIWAAFARYPIRNFLLPAAVLFVLNGLWLVWITVKNTPPHSS
ncbi:MAG TPA: hypothetical protein VLT16_14910 [Candidatus Limnocylindrales bacterium]|nr:hypothetical protein [Candidatus Limnocylindrales bacterium]